MRLSLLWLLVMSMIAALLLSGCGTVGGVVEGTGKIIQKGGRSIKNI